MNHTIEKKPRTIRFSVLDFVILFLVLACVAGIVLRSGLIDDLFVKTHARKIQVSFIAEAVTPEQDSVFTENTVFYREGERFGILTAAASESALIYYEADSGILSGYRHDTLRDLTGTFTCEALHTDNGYLLNGKTYIAPGSVFEIKANSVSVTVTVTAILPISE